MRYIVFNVYVCAQVWGWEGGLRHSLLVQLRVYFKQEHAFKRSWPGVDRL